MIKIIFLILLIACSQTVIVQADEILLNSGSRITGTIIEQTPKYVKIDTDHGVNVTYYKNEIASINQPAVSHRILTTNSTPIKLDMFKSFIIALLGALFMFKSSIIPFLGAFFIFCILIYANGCYPLMILAKKTNTPNSYHAWIPIVNIYLMCKIAQKPGWWFILCFVPLLNIIISIRLWMGIAKVRNKPEWLGILMIVPFVNLVLPWHLAAD